MNSAKGSCTSRCVAAVSGSHEAQRNKVATMAQQLLNATKDTLLNQHQHTLYMFKFGKELREHFGRQDLCITVLNEGAKRPAPEDTSDEEDKDTFDLSGQ